MTIANFIPEIWDASLLKQLRSQLTYAQAGVINRNYEGDIARAGDTVHITSFADPATRAYTKYTTISYDQLTDDTQTLVIDQARYWAITVDDIDKRQALPGFIDETTTGAAYNLRADADSFVADLMVAGVSSSAPDNEIGAVTVDAATEAYDLLVDFRTLLTRSNTPSDGRFVIVPPELYAWLLKDDRFIRQDASGTTAGLRNGVVGRAAGFDVIESNVVPEESSGAFNVIAGHSIATTFADNLVKTEALRLEGYFGDGIRGLHVYGAEVIRPANLASAVVTVG